MINDICGYCSYFIMDDIKRMQGHCPFNRYVEFPEHESCKFFKDRKREYIPNRENFKVILDTFLPCVKDEVKNSIIDRILLYSQLDSQKTVNYWIDHSNDDGILPWSLAYECPICHGYSNGKNYCPYCGAKNIRKEEEK